jgi:alpha-L-fucosidase
MKQNRLYAIFKKWPSDNILMLNCVTPTKTTQIRFLGLNGDKSASIHQMIHWKQLTVNEPLHIQEQRHRWAAVAAMSSGIEVTLPALTPDIIPCEHAWVIVLTGVAHL